MKLKISYSPTLNDLNEIDLALVITPGKDYFIGRSPDSDLVLDGPDVSRIHAKFFVQGRNYYFCDLGSRNGSIINGQLATKEIPIILRDQDVIRIGDYILTTEEIIPLGQQLPETVIKAIDPALFSGRRETEDVKNINFASSTPVNLTPEVVSAVSEPVLQEPERETQEIINPPIPEEVEAVITAPENENIIPTPEVVSEVSAPAINEALDWSTPIAEERIFIQLNNVVSETPAVSDEALNWITPIAEVTTFVQPHDLVIPTPEAPNSTAPIAEESTFIQPDNIVSDEALNSTPPIAEESTFIQPDNIVSATPVVSDEALNSTAPIAEASTVIQPDNIVSDEALNSTPPIAKESTVIQPDNVVSDEALNSTPPIAEENTVIQPDNIVSETPAVSDEALDLSTPITQESTFVQPRDLENQPPTDVSDESTNFDAPIYRDFTIYQPRDLENQPPTDVSDESTNFDAPIYRDFTIYQPRDLENQPPTDVSDESTNFDAPIYRDFTIYQPRDLENQPTADVSDESQQVVEPVAAEISANIEELEIPSLVSDVTPSPEAVSEIPAQATDEAVILNTPNLEEFKTDVWEADSTELEAVSQVPAQVTDEPAQVVKAVAEEVGEIPEIVHQVDAEDSGFSELFTTPDETVQPQAEVPEVFSNQYIDLTATTTAEVEPVEVVSSVTAQDSEVAELSNNESLPTTPVSEELEAVNVPELVSEEPELVNPTPVEVVESEEPQAEEISPAVIVSEPQQNQMIIQKNIVLIAHESKKSELAEFVAQHQEFFSRSLTVSWPSVSEVLTQQSGFTVSQQISPATSGGYQQIYSLVNSGDVLAVIFLRDFLVPQPGQANEEALLRTCNINQVLLATNLPTAEAIAHYLKHVAE